MQGRQIKLKEIIWEITGECKNNCPHCGSKEAKRLKASNNVIRDILDCIAKYPPEQINISGGDPLLIDFSLHKKIVQTLRVLKVVCKIIVNPQSIDDKKLQILSLYDYIGVSINNIAEIKTFLDKVPTKLHKKITIITNFNLSNVLAYDEIEKLVKQIDSTWQVQFTIFKEKNELALYDNEESLNFLQKKINTSMSSCSKIILADNMNDGSCSAGLFSCGILCNGDVVPCLSMRSWVDDINAVSQGNLFREKLYDNPLKKIWESGFKHYRNECFECCKDHCKNKTIKFCMPEIDWSKETLFPSEKKDGMHELPKAPKRNDQIVMLYGISPNIVTVYAVVPNQILMYGVTDTRIMAYAVMQPGVRCVYGSSIFEGWQNEQQTFSSTGEIKNNFDNKHNKKKLSE